MLIATAQMKMSWTVEENVHAIVSAIRYVQKERPALILFPELAVTGFHRGIRQEVNKVHRDSTVLERLCNACNEHSVAAWIGMPRFSADEIFNTYVLISAQGHIVAETHKLGLTKSEAILFSPGVERPISRIGGVSMATAMCREVADIEILKSQLSSYPVELLTWPGYVRNTEDHSIDAEDGSKKQAAMLAERLAVPIIQCNWANSLNEPNLTDIGGSSFINEMGQVIWSCPWNKPGIGFIDLKTNTCHWDEIWF